MNHNLYIPTLKESISGLPTLLWTVNDSSIITKYISDSSVKIIFSDENFFKSDSCVL